MSLSPTMSKSHKRKSKVESWTNHSKLKRVVTERHSLQSLSKKTLYLKALTFAVRTHIRMMWPHKANQTGQYRLKSRSAKITWPAVTPQQKALRNCHSASKWPIFSVRSMLWEFSCRKRRDSVLRCGRIQLLGINVWRRLQFLEMPLMPNWVCQTRKD